MLFIVMCTSALLQAQYPMCTDVRLKWFCMHEIYNLQRPVYLIQYLPMEWSSEAKKTNSKEKLKIMKKRKDKGRPKKALIISYFNSFLFSSVGIGFPPPIQILILNTTGVSLLHTFLQVRSTSGSSTKASIKHQKQ